MHMLLWNFLIRCLQMLFDGEYFQHILGTSIGTNVALIVFEPKYVAWLENMLKEISAELYGSIYFQRSQIFLQKQVKIDNLFC